MIEGARKKSAQSLISSFLKGHLMKKERSTRLRWLRKIINIAFGLAVFSMAAKPVLAQETVLGPKDLKIGWFGIHFSFHKFTVDDAGEGTITISKNTPEKKIRGGFARLNGKWLPIRHFLRGDDLVLEKNVNLRSRNYLFVLLRGARGASISVELKKKSLSPPPEVNFSAKPSAIKLGETSTLNWTTSYTASVSIEPGIGSVEPSGFQTVTPTETTTYTLKAKGEGGTTSKGTTVTVYQTPTVTISANPETVIYGESSTLYWSSTNADNLVIDQNIGEVGYEGSLEVKPDRTTTYTITASGPGGSVKAQAVLTVKADVEPQPDGSFGKQYEDLIPLDVTLEAYDPKRFSVVTGLARDLADLPLADVSVTILAHPEYGTAKTAIDAIVGHPASHDHEVFVNHRRRRVGVVKLVDFPDEPLGQIDLAAVAKGSNRLARMSVERDQTPSGIDENTHGLAVGPHRDAAMTKTAAAREHAPLIGARIEAPELFSRFRIERRDLGVRSRDEQCPVHHHRCALEFARSDLGVPERDFRGWDGRIARLPGPGELELSDIVGADLRQARVLHAAGIASMGRPVWLGERRSRRQQQREREHSHEPEDIGVG